MRERWVVGNWKMHGDLARNQILIEAVVRKAAGFSGASCAVCVPFPYLAQIRQLLEPTKVSWGTQNVSEFEAGAHTGEVSTAMLRDFGCRFAIVGHSERRTLYGEDSQTVARKFKRARQDGLTPILCVGETLGERESHLTEQVVAAQLSSVIDECGDALPGCMIAYEPVWAIGTGKTATPAQAQEMHDFIRSNIGVHSKSVADDLTILYGGSVKAGNARELFAMPDIDGGLIGGASLVADEFLAICAAAQ